MNEIISRALDDCIHCHLCQKKCSFLDKYKIDLGDVEKLNELSYHCFLCGECARVCPKKIDGRELVVEMRREQVSCEGEQILSKNYGGLLKEKKNYIYQNYKNASGKSVFFPGCNFPSYYPKTTKKLVTLLKETADIGVAYDCCGKPIAELGLKEQEAIIIGRLEEKFKAEGVTEVIMACPNCYYFLKPRLSISVVSIYDKLKELKIGNKIQGDRYVFPPCPDRDNVEWFDSLSDFFEQPCKMIEDAQCCGLGGCAAVNEKELAGQMIQKISEEKYGTIYAYCGSCAGNFARKGMKNVEHVLTKILDTNEKPDTMKSMLNRMKTKFM